MPAAGSMVLALAGVEAYIIHNQWRLNMRGLCHVHAAVEQPIQYLMTPLPLISCSSTPCLVWVLLQTLVCHIRILDGLPEKGKTAPVVLLYSSQSF